MAGKRPNGTRDPTLHGLLTLAREGTVERRCAALLVLGSLKLQDDRVTEAAGAALEQSNVVLKDYALRYFEDARPKSAIPFLLPLLADSDEDVRARVIRLLAGFGQAVVRPLLHHASSAPPLGQLGVAKVLCAVRGKAAWKGVLQLLARGDVELNKTVCDLVATTLREMPAHEQDELYGEVEAFAAAVDEHTPRTAVVSAIRLLGQCGRPQARKWLFGFVAADHHHALRFHALVALLHCLSGQELRKDELDRLLAILEEPEFSDLTRLTLELLESRTWSEAYQPVLARLLESPHLAVQKFALRKMGEFSSPAVVRTLIQELRDPDRMRREAAARSLRKIPAARSALLKAFLSCDDASRAWAIAEILATYEGKWRRDILDEVWQRLQTALAAQDRIQGAYLYFLKHADPAYAYAQLAGRGAQLKNAKKYHEAVRFLSPLAEFPTFNAEEKFALAVVQLKLHPHELAPTARRPEPALDLLADIYRSSAFPLFEALKKDPALAPEDLFYIGFRFVEGMAEERPLGEEILGFLARQYPRTTVGKSAKNKLKLLAA
ncbi:MAG: HEAT repeat domain-containing protein [Candidatus Binatia bacterium]|nr:HEAT repeat domain-containing protein [Candidatus Binatia bacterium]